MKITTYFSSRDDVQGIILEALDLAERRVNVAVAWFTDVVLFDRLLLLQRRGVHVSVIVTNHQFNHESKNDYQRLVNYGGYFDMIGDDRNLMHMKFCTIDEQTVISGSANWTYSAFNKHNEQITLIEYSVEQTKEYISQFEMLKEIPSVNKDHEGAPSSLNLEKIFSLFDLIKAFVTLNQISEIGKYATQLASYSETQDIASFLQKGDYSSALIQIENFRSNYSGLFSVDDFERNHLLAEEKLLLLQLETLHIQIIEAESLLDKFSHYAAIELNPILLKIIEIKRAYYQKLKSKGYSNDEFEELEKEFEKTKKDMEREQAREMPDLTDVEILAMKDAYRKASRLCHPDSSTCIFEDKLKAAEVFSSLSEARKEDDLATVLEILAQLEAGQTTFSTVSSLEELRARVAGLKHKVNLASSKFSIILSDPDYITILSIKDWPDYFAQRKIRLQQQLSDLIKQHNT